MIEVQILLYRGQQRRVDHPGDEHEKYHGNEKQDRRDVGPYALDDGPMRSSFSGTQPRNLTTDTGTVQVFREMSNCRIG